MDELRQARERGFADGVLAARQRYAQAWVDGSGESMHDHEYSQDFVSDRARELSDAREELAELRAMHSRPLTVYGRWEGDTVWPDAVGVTDDGEDVQLLLDVEPLLDGVIERAFSGSLSVWATWEDGAELPADIGLADPDGDPMDVELSADGLIEEIRRRQAATLEKELAELRAELEAVHLIGGCWEQGGGAEPCGYVATVDGEPVPLRVDASPVVNEALRRQAAAVCKRVELSDPAGPELGAVLALVPSELELLITHSQIVPNLWYAGYWRGDEQAVEGNGPTREAAIIAATRKLLGLDEDGLRRRCGGSPAKVLRAAMAWVDWRMALYDEPSGPTLYGPEHDLVKTVEQLRGGNDDDSAML